jgi:hypothetical protein
VAVGNDILEREGFVESRNGVAAYSMDGINWTKTTMPSNYRPAWRSITYGNGTFVAVSSTGTTSHAFYSTDGITWAVATSSNNEHWSDVTYGEEE